MQVCPIANHSKPSLPKKSGYKYVTLCKKGPNKDLLLGILEFWNSPREAKKTHTKRCERLSFLDIPTCTDLFAYKLWNISKGAGMDCIYSLERSPNLSCSKKWPLFKGPLVRFFWGGVTSMSPSGRNAIAETVSESSVEILGWSTPDPPHTYPMLNEIPKSPRKITIPKFQHPSTDPCPTEGFSVGHFPCWTCWIPFGNKRLNQWNWEGTPGRYPLKWVPKKPLKWC